MTNEYKQLLLTDLCARLPYCVKVWYKYYPINITEKFATSIKLSDNKIALSSKFTKEGSWHVIEEAGEILIKPYLRPMSSMTDEERKDWYRQSNVDYDCEFKPEPTLSLEHCHLSVDWLNKKGFDYRGLIPMGLALEAKEWLYN